MFISVILMPFLMNFPVRGATDPACTHLGTYINKALTVKKLTLAG